MPSRQSSRQTRAQRRAGPPPSPSPSSDEDDVTLKTPSTRAQRRAGPPPSPSPDPSSDEDEVTFKTSPRAGRGADDPIAADPQDDVSTLAGSDAEGDDEAPDSVGLADARSEAEALLRDLADSRRRRDDTRRQREQQRQERNREQKLDKQRRIEMELSQELMEELAEELAEEEAEEKKKTIKVKRSDEAPRGKKKRFQYPTPTATPALDFIPLTEGETTSFKAATLPVSALPSVVNPALIGLKERLLYSGRIPRTSSKGLQQVRHKQRASGKYGRH